MKKKLKKIPVFKNDDEEIEFWDTHDSTEYIDWSKATIAEFPNLKLTSPTKTKSITIRLPQDLLYDIKKIANKHDIPYQSYMKTLLASKVSEEKEKYQIE